jgi:glycosyltransferase involved in cell wall biosynthesis
MISVVIPTHDDETVLGRALGPLVAAVVSGLVREVILADGGSVDATLDIGEDAGCRIVAGEGSDRTRARAAAEAAHGDWVMILPPGVQLLPGWEGVVRGFVERQSTASASLPPLDPDIGWLKRLLKRPCEPVIVVRKAAYLAGDKPPVRRMAGCAVVIGRE